MPNKHGANLFFLQLRSKECDEAGTPPSTQEDANDLKTSHSPQAKLTPNSAKLDIKSFIDEPLRHISPRQGNNYRALLLQMFKRWFSMYKVNIHTCSHFFLHQIYQQMQRNSNRFWFCLYYLRI